MKNKPGPQPNPYRLSFRIRSPKHTLGSYQQVYLLLTVAGDHKVVITTGIFVERAQWYLNPEHRYRNYPRIERIETRLNVIREKIDMIYRYQAKKSQIEGWNVTTRSVIRQFQGLAFVLANQPIKPCLSGWKASVRPSTYGVGRAAGL